MRGKGAPAAAATNVATRCGWSSTQPRSEAGSWGGRIVRSRSIPRSKVHGPYCRMSESLNRQEPGRFVQTRLPSWSAVASSRDTAFGRRWTLKWRLTLRSGPTPESGHPDAPGLPGRQAWNGRSSARISQRTLRSNASAPKSFKFPIN